MPRPKSSRFVGVKMPDVMHDDIRESCAMITRAVRLREPLAKEKTVADWVKEACEFRLTLMKGLRIGYYALRQIPDLEQGESGLPDGKRM